MKETNKEVMTMNAQELVTEVAKATGLTKVKVNEVIKAMNDISIAALKEAKEGTSVVVKLFPGLNLTSEFDGVRKVRRPSDGAIVDKPAGIKVKGKVTIPMKNAVNA